MLFYALCFPSLLRLISHFYYPSPLAFLYFRAGSREKAWFYWSMTQSAIFDNFSDVDWYTILAELPEARSYEAFARRIAVRFTSAGDTLLHLSWTGRHVGPVLYGLRPLWLGSTCSLNTNPIRMARQTGIMYCMYGQKGIWPHFYTLLLFQWTLSPHN